MFLSYIKATAQPYYFKHLQVENGLSNNTVTSCFQDSYGFMWFGTKDGLNRYDGYTFKIFNWNENDSLSLGNNFIKCIHEDENRNIWVGTERGLYQYNRIHDNFRLLKLPSQQLTEIRAIKTDKQGNLWFISNYRLYRFSRDQILHEYPEFNSSSIAIADDGTFWASARSNLLFKYDPAKDTFQTLSISSVFNSGGHAPIRIEKLLVVNENTILIGSSNYGLIEFSLGDSMQSATARKILSKEFENTFVRDILKVTDDEFWLATEAGIFIYHRQDNKLVHLQKNFNDPYSLSDNAVYSLFKDIEGGIWAGTYFGGLNYIPKANILFRKIFTKRGENSVVGNAIREICKDAEGNLWIGTEDAGLNVLEKKTGKFIHYKPTMTSGSIGYHNIHALLVIDNNLWIGTFKHGLEVMDLKTRKITKRYFEKVHTGSEEDFVYSLLERNNGDIYAGTATGLYVLKPGDKSFTQVSWLPTKGLITQLYEDSKGNIWIGTNRDGLFKYSIATNRLINLNRNQTGANYLPTMRVDGILEYHDGTFWFCSDNGLIHYDANKSKVIRKYDETNGLKSKLTFRALEGDKGEIWVSTSRGLVYLDPLTQKIKVYTTANGLLSDQFNYNSAYKDENGIMYFGTVKGLIQFDPDKMVVSNVAPPVYIIGMQFNDKEVSINQPDSPLKESITHTRKIELDYTQSTFSLNFAALSFTAPEMTQYYYKMEGLDNTWVHLTNNRKVYFTNLAPGRYRFIVKADVNNKGQTGELSTAVLDIKIVPPWWASYWAYSAYSIIVLLAMWFLIAQYHRRIKNKNNRKLELFQNEKERELYNAKIEFFTNIAHEIKTPLTLIKLPLEKVIVDQNLSEEIKGNLRIMEKNTNRLISLSSQLLDFRKAEKNIFSLSFVKTDICDVLNELIGQFKPAADEKMHEISSELPRMHFQAYVDQEAFKKIISNLLSNAIKYGDRKVSICILPFSSTDTTFTIQITNDGKEIPHELKDKIFDPLFRVNDTHVEGTGIGLALALSLTKLHEGTLKVDSRNRLTSFLLTLPFHQEKEFQLFDESFTEPTQIPSETELSSEIENHNIIMLVEDNPEILEFISKELSKDYKIIRAVNGKDALEKLSKTPVDLIISDVMMPVMDGFTLCQEIKSAFDYCHIPLILLTAKNTLQSKINGLEMGADAYIEKPFSQQHLNAQINSLLVNRNKIKEHFSGSPLANIKSLAHSKSDETFVIRITDIIIQQLDNSELGVELLASKMNMSRQTLYRKIKALTDLTPHEFIMVTKLKRAAELLVTGDYKIYEVADLVGYTVSANFSRDFMKQFGISPSEYMSSANSMKSSR